MEHDLDPLLAVLPVLMVAVPVLAPVGGFAFYVLFVHELMDRLVPRTHASLLSGATALLSGAGAFLLLLPLGFWRGWVLGSAFAVGALAGAGWSALVLMRRRRDGGRWLSRTRSWLHGCLDPRYRPAGDEYVRAMARVRRIERTGDRLSGRADGLAVVRIDRTGGLTIELRLRRPSMAAVLMVAAWMCTSGAIALSTMVVYGRGVPSLSDLVAVATLGLVVLTGLAGVLLRMDSRRWRLRRTGAELTGAARRAVAALTAHEGAPA